MLKKKQKKIKRNKNRLFKGNNKDNKLINIISDNKNNENISKNIKIRNPGIDLARLISMYCVIIHHFYYIAGGFRKYSKYSKQLKVLEVMISWHIDGFALISGIVGYKTNKYSNLLYLWLDVLFYSIGFHYYFSKKKAIIENKWIEFFPMVFFRYWYFTAYFGMYLFLPIINKGISILSQSELRLVVISTLGIFVFWRRHKNPGNDIFHLNSGESTIWILIFYITGAYIGKYRKDYKGIKKYIYCFICLFICNFNLYK